MTYVLFPHQNATQQELNELRDRLGLLTALSMQEMTQKTEAVKRDQNLNEGIWNPYDYMRTLGNRHPRRLAFFKGNGHLVHGWAPVKYWEPIYDPIDGQTIRRIWSFIAKKDVPILDAIKAAKVGLSILDCGAVCQLARYDALIQVLGVERAVRLFEDVRINIDYVVDDERQPMRYFVRLTPEAIIQQPDTVNHRMVKVGQTVLFNGVSGYEKKHPTGMGSNYNVICLNATPGHQLYVGHGLPSQGVSEEQLAQIMVQEYNQDPDLFSRVPPEDQSHLEEVPLIKNSGTYKDSKVSESQPLERVLGFDCASMQDFCIELIYDLLQVPPEEVSLEIVISHPRSNKNYLFPAEEHCRYLLQFFDECKAALHQ